MRVGGYLGDRIRIQNRNVLGKKKNRESQKNNSLKLIKLFRDVDV